MAKIYGGRGSLMIDNEPLITVTTPKADPGMPVSEARHQTPSPVGLMDPVMFEFHVLC